MEDPFGDGKYLSGQEKISNGVEQRNKPGASFESLGPFFLSNTEEVTWDSHSYCVSAFGECMKRETGKAVARPVAFTDVVGLT